MDTGIADRLLGISPWPGDPTIVQIHLRDHRATPADGAVAAVLERLRAAGTTRVRTGILFPAAAATFARHGFVTVDCLRLLERPGDAPVPAARGVHRIGRLTLHRGGDLGRNGPRAAARVDQAAFGPVWGYDGRAVRAMARATPLHRARGVRVGGRLGGYLVAGIAQRTGYIQRLAVDPAAQRRGVARDLVIDALVWAGAHRVHSVLVNTGMDNSAALALYGALGFGPRDEVLTIAERAL